MSQVDKLVLAEVNYTFKAYSCSERIKLKGLSEQHFRAYEVETISPGCLLVDLAADQKIFIFRFGAVVFFNIPELKQHEVLSLLGIVDKRTKIEDSDEVQDDDFILKVVDGQAVKVDFNSATVSSYDNEILLLISQILAQSSALAHVEETVEEMVKQSETMLQPLRKRGWITSGRTELLQFLGDSLDERHRLAKHLIMLQSSESTWEREDLYKLNTALIENFELSDRVSNVENTLNIASEAATLLVETLNTRRSEFLELVIIILIAVEIVKSLF